MMPISSQIVHFHPFGGMHFFTKWTKILRLLSDLGCSGLSLHAFYQLGITKWQTAMFHLFFLSVVLFYVLFFSLAAKYIRESGGDYQKERKLSWTNAMQ